MPKSFVTGGSGFVGKALAKALVIRGHSVTVTSRTDLPDLESFGIEVLKVDLTGDLGGLKSYLRNVDAVFHTAAKVAMWGKFEDFYRTNVEATRALLKLAQGVGVEKFIYTSSPSVVANGADLCNVDESTPYPDTYEAFYPQTKAEAEREVLAMNSQHGMKTIALRPHLIFGPGDTNLIPTVVAKAQAGRLVRIGDGMNLTDLTFIEDCVDAHIAAYESLGTNPRAAGRPYFISQGEPVRLWDWVDSVLAGFQLGPVKRSIPLSVARLLAHGAEWWAKRVAPEKEPFLTSFLVSEMATSHYFNIGAARAELGYAPRRSIQQAMHETFVNAGVE
jgi:nucleoside-diphosphate-sugar epimerase